MNNTDENVYAAVMKGFAQLYGVPLLNIIGLSKRVAASRKKGASTLASEFAHEYRSMLLHRVLEALLLRHAQASYDRVVRGLTC